MNKGELIFQYTKPNRGFVFKVWELPDSKGDALIEVERDGKVMRSFSFPAYKVCKDTEGYILANKSLDSGQNALQGN